MLAFLAFSLCVCQRESARARERERERECVCVFWRSVRDSDFFWEFLRISDFLAGLVTMVMVLQAAGNCFFLFFSSVCLSCAFAFFCSADRRCCVLFLLLLSNWSINRWINENMYVCINICIYIHTHTHICIYIYCVCVCVYIYIYTPQVLCSVSSVVVQQKYEYLWTDIQFPCDRLAWPESEVPCAASLDFFCFVDGTCAQAWTSTSRTSHTNTNTNTNTNTTTTTNTNTNTRPGPVRHGPLDHLYYRLGAGPCAHRVQRLQVCQCGSAAVGLFCALDRSLLPYAQASFASYACLRHARALVAGLFCSSRSLLPHRLISLATDTGLFWHLSHTCALRSDATCKKKKPFKKKPFF